MISNPTSSLGYKISFVIGLIKNLILKGHVIDEDAELHLQMAIAHLRYAKECQDRVE